MGRRRVTPQQAWRRLWRSVDQDYGQAGTAAPELRPVGRGGGFAYTQGQPGTTEADPYQPERAVFGNPGFRKQLASAKPKASREARFTALHELGHLFGPKGSGPTGDEGLANRAANLSSRRLNRRGPLERRARSRT